MLKSLAAVAITGVLLAGCQSYVTRGEFNDTVSSLRAKDDSLSAQLNDMNQLFGEMTGDLHSQFSQQNARITSLEGRLRVDMTANFGYNDATLRAEDRPALDQFIEIVRGREENLIITVEGFTDPAGDPEYNKWLGMQRARAVADYLINVGGLERDRVRAVSYGEDAERLIKPGAWGANGAANRRVALVVDYIGSPGS